MANLNYKIVAQMKMHQTKTFPGLCSDFYFYFFNEKMIVTHFS